MRVSAGEDAVLDVIRRLGGRATLTQIASQLGLPAHLISNRLQVMRAKGGVEKSGLPRYRGQWMLGISKTGILPKPLVLTRRDLLQMAKAVIDGEDPEEFVRQVNVHRSKIKQLSEEMERLIGGRNLKEGVS
jgi:hypothetical protein